MVSSFSWCMSTLRVCQVAPYLQWQRTLRLQHLGCCRCIRPWMPSTCILHQWSVILWSTGLVFWIWGAVGKFLPACQEYLVLIYITLWCGAPNLLLSCLITRFQSVSTPWILWWMDRMRWYSWIQWVHGIHFWISKSELLLWIQMWIHHLPIIGKNQITWTWSGHTCQFQLTKKFTCCRSWGVLR